MLRFLDWDLNLPTCCYITELLVTRSLSFEEWIQSQRHTVTSSSRQFSFFSEMKKAFLRAVKEVRGVKYHQLRQRLACYFRCLIFICKRRV